MTLLKILLIVLVSTAMGAEWVQRLIHTSEPSKSIPLQPVAEVKKPQGGNTVPKATEVEKLSFNGLTTILHLGYGVQLGDQGANGVAVEDSLGVLTELYDFGIGLRLSFLEYLALEGFGNIQQGIINPPEQESLLFGTKFIGRAGLASYFYKSQEGNALRGFRAFLGGSYFLWEMTEEYVEYMDVVEFYHVPFLGYGMYYGLGGSFVQEDFLLEVNFTVFHDSIHQVRQSKLKEGMGGLGLELSFLFGYNLF